MSNLPHRRPAEQPPASSLVILGAGPKAVAVQAKAHALRTLGLPSPTVTVVDYQGSAVTGVPAVAGPTVDTSWARPRPKTSDSRTAPALPETPTG
nr:hypothetical protein [Corynebacterium sp. CNJ-954]